MRRTAAQATEEARAQLGDDATEEDVLDLARRLIREPLPDPLRPVRGFMAELEHKAMRARQTLREADRPGIKPKTRKAALGRAGELLAEVRLALNGAAGELEGLKQEEETDHG